VLHHLIPDASTLAAFVRQPRHLRAGMRYALAVRHFPAIKKPKKLTTIPPDDEFRHISFTYAVIALSARIARAGHGLTRRKYIAFRAGFPLRDGVCGKVRHLFRLACEDKTPLAHYIVQIEQLFPERADLYSEFLDRLFGIATADGGLGEEEELLLQHIANSLALTPWQYATIHARHLGKPSAHKQLGVARNSPANTIKKRYHQLMREFHPDRMGSQQLSPELELLLQLRSSQISQAYRQLTGHAV